MDSLKDSIPPLGTIHVGFRASRIALAEMNSFKLDNHTLQISILKHSSKLSFKRFRSPALCCAFN
jgi:hypothetical protein